jgi:hypothetical protein
MPESEYSDTSICKKGAGHWAGALVIFSMYVAKLKCSFYMKIANTTQTWKKHDYSIEV